jgi:hypothetical protein
MCCSGCYSCSVWSILLFCFARVALVSDRHYLCNKYILFVTFVYLRTLYIRVCGINDHGHTYDEYLVLLAKSSMTEVLLGTEQTPPASAAVAPHTTA